MSSGRPRLVGVLVVHRVLAGEVPAVLGQHFREDNVSLVPEDGVVGVTDDVEAEESVGDVKVEDKVQRLLCGGCQTGDGLVCRLNGWVEIL